MDDRDLQPILDFVGRFTRDRGFPPTYAEIAEACGLGSVGHVQYRVNRLIAAGRLARTPGLARSLKVVGQEGAKRTGGSRAGRSRAGGALAGGVGPSSAGTGSAMTGLLPRVRRWLGRSGRRKAGAVERRAPGVNDNR